MVRPKLANESISKIKTLSANGFSKTEIAKMLGCTLATVMKYTEPTKLTWYWEIVDPYGNAYYTNNLTEFCKEYKLVVQCMRDTFFDTKASEHKKRGTHRGGWQILNREKWIDQPDKVIKGKYPATAIEEMNKLAAIQEAQRKADVLKKMRTEAGRKRIQTEEREVFQLSDEERQARRDRIAEEKMKRSLQGLEGYKFKHERI